MKYLKYLGILAVVAGIGIAIALYLYNKPHKDMNRATSELTVDAVTLFKAFETDEAAGNETYLGKVITVTGSVRETSIAEGVTTVVLDVPDNMFAVRCELDPLAEHKRTDFAPGEQVSLKGSVSGMSMDVLLNRCVEVK